MRSRTVSGAGFTVALLLLVGAFWKVALPYGFASDSFYKLYQTHSLLVSGYRSEEFVYPARDVDPDFYHFQGKGLAFYLTAGGKHIGQYPVAFSLVSAPFYQALGTDGLALLGLLPLAGLLWLMIRFWGLPRWLALLAILVTPLAFYAFEYSENLLFLFLSAAGITQIFRSSRRHGDLVGAALLGLAAWFRIEVIPFVAALALSMIWVDGWRWQEIRWRLVPYGRLAIGFLIAVAGFVSFNLFDYGHPLGPRFLANAGYVSFTVAKKAAMAFVFVLGGPMKPGVFGYTPLFLLVYAVGWGRSRFGALSREGRILLLAPVIHTVFVVLTVHSDPIIQWGPRYLHLVFFPLILVGWEVMQKAGLASSGSLLSLWKSQRTVVGLVAVLACYSVGLSVYGMKTAVGASTLIRQTEKTMGLIEAEYHVSPDEFLLGFAGRNAFERKYLLSGSVDDFERLLRRIKVRSPGSTVAFYLLSPGMLALAEQREDPREKAPLWGRPYGLLAGMTSTLSVDLATEAERQRLLAVLRSELAGETSTDLGHFSVHFFRVPGG